MAQRLILVRHGTTEWLERGLIQGASESDLTPRGVHESELTAAALKLIPFNIAFFPYVVFVVLILGHTLYDLVIDVKKLLKGEI